MQYHKNEIGMFNRKIRIQKAQKTRQSTGELVEDWINAYEVWAKRRDTAGTLLNVSQRETFFKVISYTVRYSEAMYFAMSTYRFRIVDKNQIFYVTRVDNIKGENNFCEIIAQNSPDVDGSTAA